MEKRRRERRKARGNQVSGSESSFSDMEPPVEPIVIIPDQTEATNYNMHQ